MHQSLRHAENRVLGIFARTAEGEDVKELAVALREVIVATSMLLEAAQETDVSRFGPFGDGKRKMHLPKTRPRVL